MPKNNTNGVRMSMTLTPPKPQPAPAEPDHQAQRQALRVLFEGRRATGLEVESGGERFMVQGDEIVLSAGPVAPRSADALGVGPEDHLREFGIPVFTACRGSDRICGTTRREVSLRVRDDAALDPGGPWTNLTLRYTATGSPTRNDIMISQAYPPGPPYGDASVGDDSRSPAPWSSPGSGELRLASSDPHVYPVLDYRYLEDPLDRERMREASGCVCASWSTRPTSP